MTPDQLIQRHLKLARDARDIAKHHTFEARLLAKNFGVPMRKAIAGGAVVDLKRMLKNGPQRTSAVCKKLMVDRRQIRMWVEEGVIEYTGYTTDGDIKLVEKTKPPQMTAAEVIEDRKQYLESVDQSAKHIGRMLGIV
jgi:hypothetical protein